MTSDDRKRATQVAPSGSLAADGPVPDGARGTVLSGVSARLNGRHGLSSGDLLAALAFLLLYAATAVAIHVMGAPWPLLVPSVVLASTLSLLAAVDLRSYRLPDALTFP